MGSTGIASKPFILITSSLKSASPWISCLHDGIVHNKILLFFLFLMPNLFKIFSISLWSISIPKRLEFFIKSNEISCVSVGILPQISVSLISPPHISCINKAALSSPIFNELASTPLSKRYRASLSINNFLPVLAVFSGLKSADSKSTFLVSRSQDEEIPPSIPPKPSAALSSDITHIPSSREYSLSSRPKKASFFLADLTTIFPLILSAS